MVIICISGMFGSGIFVLPGIIYQDIGTALPLAYLIAALGVLPTVFSKSELSTAMPTSGGTYIYVERTFGPLMGMIAGLGLWLSLLLKCSFALTGFGAYLSIFTSVDITYTSLFLLGLMTMLNTLGVGKVTSTLFIVVLMSILALTGISLLALSSVPLNTYTSLLDKGIQGPLSAAATVFISYAGVTKIAAIAGEVKDPEKGLPRGMLYSLLITTFVYCLATTALVGVLKEDQLSGNLRPFFTLGQIVGGQTTAYVLSFIAILTMTSMANAGLLAASRFPFAMGQDNLLPSFFGKISKRFVTPMTSILASALIIALSILLENLENIVKTASAFMILMFLIVNISVVILREARVQWYQPTYKSPFYPFTQVFGIFFCILLLWNIDLVALNSIIVLALFGSLIFITYSRKRIKRKGVVGIRGKRKDFTKNALLSNSHPAAPSQSFEICTEFNIVIALFGQERSAEMLTEMGIALSNHGNVEVAHITEIPEQTELDEIFETPIHVRSLKRRITAMAIEKKCPITFDPIITHDVVKTIYDIGLRSHCQWLFIEWIRKTRGTLTSYGPMGWAKNHLKCNLAIFHNTGIRYIRKIMALIRHDHNDMLVSDTADNLAQVFNADITFVSYSHSVSSKGKTLEKESYLKKLAKDCTPNCHFLVLSPSEHIAPLIAQTMEFDLLVLGGEEHRFINNFISSQDSKIIENAACSVMSVQSFRAER